MAEHGVSSCPPTQPGQGGAAPCHPSWTDLAIWVEKLPHLDRRDTVVTPMLRTQYICLVGAAAKVNVATVQPPSLVLAKCAEGSVTQL